MARDHDLGCRGKLGGRGLSEIFSAPSCASRSSVVFLLCSITRRCLKYVTWASIWQRKVHTYPAGGTFLVKTTIQRSAMLVRSVLVLDTVDDSMLLETAKEGVSRLPAPSAGGPIRGDICTIFTSFRGRQRGLLGREPAHSVGSSDRVLSWLRRSEFEHEHYVIEHKDASRFELI